MGRKTGIVKITAEGRDKGKVFKLTEMPALRTEKWATRAFLAMAHAGVEIPPGLENSGMAGIAALGFAALANIDFDSVEPLLDEMLECVQIIRDPSHPDIAMPMIEGDLEEVATVLQLRKAVFELHLGFTLADVRSMSTSASAATETTSPNTSTSPAPSEQSSPAA